MFASYIVKLLANHVNIVHPLRYSFEIIFVLIFWEQRAFAIPEFTTMLWETKGNELKIWIRAYFIYCGYFRDIADTATRARINLKFRTHQIAQQYELKNLKNMKYFLYLRGHTRRNKNICQENISSPLRFGKCMALDARAEQKLKMHDTFRRMRASRRQRKWKRCWK